MDTLILKEAPDDTMTPEFWGSCSAKLELTGDYELLQLWVNEVMVGYICLEYQFKICVLHLHIFEKDRTKETIMHLVKGFTEVVHPWIKNRGASSVVVQCNYEDTKTMELFKTFGYEPKAVWFASMEV